MVSTNISREEAALRSAAVTVHSYDVSLDLTTAPEVFRSTTVIRFGSTAEETWLDLIAPTLLTVTVNGEELRPGDVYDGARITLSGLQAENEVRVVADCAFMNTGEGLHRFVDPVDDEVYLYSQFETADARRMYACFEQPDLKGTFQLSVVAPDHWRVLSNSPTPVPELLGEHRARWDFEPTPVISTYITALVAGPYEGATDSYVGLGGTYPLGVYCRKSLVEHLDPEEILTVTKQGFAFFEREFDRPYPFAKYDQIFVPEFNAGAMENAGCVTFLEDYVFRSRVTHAAYEQRANTILHELSHMWFGDLVTMKWWDDLWLNESFAEWASHHASVMATRYVDAWNTFSVQRKAWAYRQDQLPSTHPIAADMTDLDAVRVNFDGITYAKGASALKQLVAWVGESEFLSGLRAYFAEFEWQNTQLSDLLKHLEAASGRDLATWTQEWLQHSGVNLLRPDIREDADGVMTEVVVVQEPPAMPPGLPPILREHRIGIGLYQFADGHLVRDQLIEVDVRGQRTQVPQLVGVTRPDLLLVNDRDLTFAKIRLDDRSVTTAINSIASIDEPLARTLLWAAVWDMTRDAELSCGDYVALVRSGLGSEPDVAVVQTILRQVKAAVDQYAAPANRSGYADAMAEATWQWARAAAPGSDHQLAFVRGFASFAQSGEDLAIIERLLEGEETLDGLAIDTDLRWTLLLALARGGAADAERVEAEARRDDTATGRRHRAQALAAMPSAQAKDAAWQEMVSNHSIPNAILDANLAGFSQGGQEDLLTPYVDRYFEVIPRVWEERTPEMAQSITTLLYPYLAVDEGTIAAAQELLDHEGLHPAAARLVREGADATQRALKARERDARAGDA